MAKLAKANNYTQPRLTPGNELEACNTRHPLLEMCEDVNFIKNDYNSSPESGCIKIVYGSNQSGKTIYLKQVCNHNHHTKFVTFLLSFIIIFIQCYIFLLWTFETMHCPSPLNCFVSV